MASKPTKTKLNPFLESELEKVNKTESDLVHERVTSFLEEAAIETEVQISERKTGAIPRKQLELKNLLLLQSVKAQPY
jgi:hypothetical protein